MVLEGVAVCRPKRFERLRTHCETQGVLFRRIAAAFPSPSSSAERRSRLSIYEVITKKEVIVFSNQKLAAASVVFSCLVAGPAFAQTHMHANAAAAQRVVDRSATAVREMNSSPQFAQLLKQAKGVFLVPDLVKGAVVVGGSGGTGVLLVRNNGHWSDPAFLTIGSISIGAQAGGRAGPVAMFLMTDKAVAGFIKNSNFALNGNANLTIVNWSPNSQGSVGKGDVVVWSGASGLFAGLDISGSDVVADTSYDRAYYNDEHAGTKAIIDNREPGAKARKLMSELPS